MKRIYSFSCFVLSLLVTTSLALQPPTQTPTSTYEVTERAAHHRIWSRAYFETNALGRIIFKTNSYTELETGMHYLKDGEWRESRPEIKLTEHGGIVDELFFRVRFGGNVNTADAVEIAFPDGFDTTRLKMSVVGLSYFDPVSGKSVLIAEVKDSQGLLLSSKNQLLFADAFRGIEADVLYTVTKAGLSQWIVLYQQPLPPSHYGLGKDSRLQVLTEFVDLPPPEQTRRALPNGLSDIQLTWGEMQMGKGKAFATGNRNRKGVSVAKSLQTQNGRIFLVEEVEFKTIESEIRQLPTTPPAKQVSDPNSVLNRVANDRILPARRLPGHGLEPNIQIASVDVRAKTGFVLDYELSGAQSDFTFEGDTTYYLNGEVSLSGTTTIEGGAVLKFSTNGLLNASSETAMVCKTAPYRPAIFTAKDDDTVGETISGSTGSPTGYYGIEWSAPKGPLSNLRLKYMTKAIKVDGSLSLTNIQVINCRTAFGNMDGMDITVQNGLFYNISMFSDGYEQTFRGSHLTIHTCSNLSFANPDATGSSFFLTNSLLIGVTNLGNVSWTTNTVVRLSDDGSAFQTAGAAAHYLAINSPYRNLGTTNISAGLLAQLKQKTTFAPTVITNQAITNNQSLSIQAARDTDTPDLGYHYDPLDYLLGRIWFSNATVTVTAGTAIGAIHDYGFSLKSGVNFICEGSPTNLNRIVHFATVQEQWINWTPNPSVWGSYFGYSVLPQAKFRFTDWSVPGGNINHFSAYDDSMALSFNDCQFHGGGVIGGATPMNFTNCLFERTFVVLSSDYIYDAGFRNNLFFGGELFMASDVGIGTWTFRDNLFDHTELTQLGLSFDHDYNGYTVGSERLTNNAPHDVVTNITYQIGPLGNYYQPANSDFINKGSRTASAAGLYHYTTTTNQVQETNSTVDIGFHYVAVINGAPINSDADALADYFEDQDGDGVKDSNESNFTVTDTDSDGLDDGEEYSLETNPNTANTLTFQILDADGNALNPAVTNGNEKVAIRTDLIAQLRLDSAPANIPGLTYSWQIGGERIKSYYHDIDEVSNGAYHEHAEIPLTGSDLITAATNGIFFFWKRETNAVPVAFSASKGFFARGTTLYFDVFHTTDPNRYVYTWLTNVNNEDSVTARRNPDGLAYVYKLLKSHGNFHNLNLLLMDDGTAGERPYPFINSGGVWVDPDGGELYWGDQYIVNTFYNGSTFLTWHRGFIDSHFAWRSTFNVGAIANTNFPAIPPNSENLDAGFMELREFMKRNPSSWPPPPPSGVTTNQMIRSSLYGYVRLGEFQNLDELAQGFATWHGKGHVVLQLVDPASVMIDVPRSPGAGDDLFWRWHSRVDEPRYNWVAGGGPDRAGIAQLNPSPGSTVSTLNEVIVTFSNRVSAGAPDANGVYAPPSPTLVTKAGQSGPTNAVVYRNKILLRAEYLTVNGSPATQVQEAGGANSINMVFKFTGFSNPGTGTVNIALNDITVYTNTFWSDANVTNLVVLTNQASYVGTNWSITVQP